MNIFNKVTIKTMKENRVRTVVTIIGVILSAAMFTAITTLCSSMMNYLKNNYIYQNGDYHVSVKDIDYDKLNELKNDENTSSVVTAEYLGYANEIGSTNENKPFIYLLSTDKNFTDTMPVHLTSGKLPENNSEILLPAHLSYNGGVNYKIGDTITLNLGDRILDDEPTMAMQNSPYDPELSGHESFKVREKKSFTVVGIYERPDFEAFSAPGYTALTFGGANDNPNTTYEAYIKINRVDKNINSYIKNHSLENYNFKTNWDVIMFSGVFRAENQFNFITMAGLIFMLIILIGSVSLIYSAFSISVNERTKQFGLLSSIGATKKQIKKSVFFESFVISIIGIPIGIVCGITGIGITLHFIGDTFGTLFINSGVTLSLSVSAISIIAAAVISFVTVLISALIPSRRATKITAIEAIRQSKDITAKSKKVKISKLSYKLFGLEALLAKKYFKRSKKKYRATIVSLAMSIILFITTSGFCMYLTDIAKSEVEISNYDIAYKSNSPDKVIRLYDQFSQTEGVSGVSYDAQFSPNFIIENSDLDESYINYLKAADYQQAKYERPLECFYVDDNLYNSIIKTYNLDESKYQNRENPPAIIINSGHLTVWNYDEKREAATKTNYDVSYLKSDIKSFSRVEPAPKAEGFDYITNEEYDGNLFYCYTKTGEEIKFDKDNKMIYDFTIPAKFTEIEVGDLITENKLDLPFGFNFPTNYQPILIYPYSACPNDLDYQTKMYFNTDNYETGIKNIKKILSDNGMSVNNSALYDNIADENASRNLLITVNILVYGFVILISLIATANVFNTISTNISLRRRDFAMLRSIGITNSGLNKMMNYECIMYGTKSILWGIPIATALTLLIYFGMFSSEVMYPNKITLPWSAFIISILIVFTVVFLTMLYSMNKVKKDNPIDTLRNENI